MAEIVLQVPPLSADYASIVVLLLETLAEEDLEHFRAGVLWAIGRLGTGSGDHIPAVLPAITSALTNTDPQVRGMAVWCLEQAGQSQLLESKPDLLTDEGQVDLYENGSLNRTSVGKLVQRALE